MTETAGALGVGEAAILTGTQVAGESKVDSQCPDLGEPIKCISIPQVSPTHRVLSQE